MRALTFVAVCAAIAAVAVAHKYVETEWGTYAMTPVGYIRSDCVHDIPSGARVERVGNATFVHHATGSRVLPNCDRTDPKRPMFIATPTSLASASGSGSLPADYDGWEEYTAYKTDNIDVFTGYFSVPDEPQADPQVLYLFTGLQNIDWIPKVDPEPSTPFDIIQPVLQYPSNEGSGWSVRSWYVTLDVGAAASDEQLVNSGDQIFGNMTRISATEYFIGSTVVSNGLSTTITFSNSRLKTQPWAYNTLECYGCDGCSTYPTQPCKFTDLVMSTKGTTITPTWAANPKPAQDRQCHESVSIDGPSTVTISFQ